MTNLLELIKKEDTEIDDYLTNVDLEQFKSDIRRIQVLFSIAIIENDQQTEIDKKIDQLSQGL